MNIEKTVQYNNLFDIYDSLLTAKQREVFQMYYHDDLSYQEIAEFLEITRTAVYDNLRRTLQLLDEYEEKLKVLDLLTRLQNLENEQVNTVLNEYSRRKL